MTHTDLRNIRISLRGIPGISMNEIPVHIMTIHEGTRKEVHVIRDANVSLDVPKVRSFDD